MRKQRRQKYAGPLVRTLALNEFVVQMKITMDVLCDDLISRAHGLGWGS